METFKIVGLNYSFVIMKNGVRIDYNFDNSQEYIHYSTIKNIHNYKSGKILIRIIGDKHPYEFPMDEETSEKIMPVLTKYMENFYNESDKTQQIMDELAEIKQQLSALFYAPGFSGSLQAKASFEEKSKN
jgi:uncharacterized protein YktA (UPF0223 family)